MGLIKVETDKGFLNQVMWLYMWVYKPTVFEGLQFNLEYKFGIMFKI